MKIYLDTNIYCRPLDDQNQSRIALEAKACIMVLGTIEKGDLLSFGSDILLFELSQTNKIKQSYIMPFTKFWKSRIRLSNKIVREAEIIQNQLKLKSRDSLHLAFAISAKSAYLLTCDDEFLAKTKKYAKIKVINPLDFIKDNL